MSFEKWGYQFDGPYYYPVSLKKLAGVYVVWYLLNDVLNILDVGESDNVKEHIEKHERGDFWKKKCASAIKYSATYISDRIERLKLKKLILNSEYVFCGER